MAALISSWPTTAAPPAPYPATVISQCGEAITRVCQDQHTRTVNALLAGELPLAPGGQVVHGYLP